jgi:hypothetical protein
VDVDLRKHVAGIHPAAFSTPMPASPAAASKCPESKSKSPEVIMLREAQRTSVDEWS